MLPAPLRGAETTGAIVGVAHDAAGAPVSGAAVDAASPSGSYHAHADGRGRFTLAALTADTYTVSIAASGFATDVEHGVTVTPGATVRLEVTLAASLREIGHVATAARAVSVGAPQDSYLVTGAQARGETRASASGLASYARGTVQGAVSGAPGVQQDQFANIVLRGGKVEDTVFSFDAVPIPQAIIAEPGGNVVGAQLPTTGLGYTTVTTGGFAAGSDDALGGLVDEVPESGVYPARTTLTTGVGLAGAAHDAALESRWATPSLDRRFAIDATVGAQAIRYGDGRSFYPAEAATYGLALDERSTWSVSGNAHLRLNARDDFEVLALGGQATYDQYGTPFAGETFAGAPATAPTRIRGTYAIEKIQLLRTFEHAYARLRVYRSQYGARTGAPFFDDLSFPNGAISYAGAQSGVLTGSGLDVKSFDLRHTFAYGAELRRQTTTLDQVVTPYGIGFIAPSDREVLTANPVLSSALAYASDAWSPSPQFTLQGALRAQTTHVARGDGPRYDVASVDPHLAAVLHLRGGAAFRLAYDHTTVAPRPLEAERHDSAQPGAPFVPLAPERGSAWELSYERSLHAGALRLTAFSKDDRDRIDVIPTNFRTPVGAGQNPGTSLGVPQNVGALLANGAELALQRGPFDVTATYVHARSSSASQFGLNDLNAPAIAANHLFPVGYVPDLSIVGTYRARAGAVTIAPTLSWESGYPYGNGRAVWTYDANGVPVRVPNDNHVNPGYSYYFLRDPALPFDAVTNPYIGSLGTPEGDDPNTLRSTPLLLASLHVEAPVAKRVTLLLDVANLFGTATPTQRQGNPYLIGPPGYTGGNAAYSAWYAQQIGGSAYDLGNGVPTLDGRTPALPWRYGTGGYVPSSYPEARSVYLRVRVTL